MFEYEVKFSPYLKKQPEYVFADTYVTLGGMYQFYIGDQVVQEYPSADVVSCQKSTTEGGEAITIERVSLS